MVVGNLNQVMQWKREFAIPPRRTDRRQLSDWKLMLIDVLGHSTAVAALISLMSLFTAIWGLHLRLRAAQTQWKGEAVMVRRRSMALSAAAAAEGRPLSTIEIEKAGGRRWSDAPDYNGSVAHQPQGYRGSMIKDPDYGAEERLETDLDIAKRNSREQEMMVRRAS